MGLFEWYMDTNKLNEITNGLVFPEKKEVIFPVTIWLSNELVMNPARFLVQVDHDFNFQPLLYNSDKVNLIKTNEDFLDFLKT